jgi:hypothetical protein
MSLPTNNVQWVIYRYTRSNLAPNNPRFRELFGSSSPLFFLGQLIGEDKEFPQTDGLYPYKVQWWPSGRITTSHRSSILLITEEEAALYVLAEI